MSANIRAEVLNPQPCLPTMINLKSMPSRHSTSNASITTVWPLRGSIVPTMRKVVTLTRGFVAEVGRHFEISAKVPVPDFHLTWKSIPLQKGMQFVRH